MKTFKQLLSVLCTIVLFLAMFSVTNQILMRKESRVKYQQFTKDERTYDVIFFGTSHILNSISPLDLFHEYGISSFNFANHSANIINSYYQLREIHDSFKDKLPKTIVLDVFNDARLLERTHRSWDYFKPGKNKWLLANTLFKEHIGELMFPFSIYHGRWNEAFKEFDIPINVLFGVEPRYGVRLPEKEIITDKNDKMKYDNLDMEYLEKFRVLCEELNIKLILIQVPYSYKTNRQRQANDIYEYAQKHKLTYVNYMNENIDIDFKIDFSDPGHVNPVGMRILTNQVGKLLQKSGLPDRRKEPIAKRWNSDYNKYIDIRINRLKNLNNLFEFLMACNDPDLTADIYANGELLQNEQIQKLIRRLQNNGCSIHLSFGKVPHKKNKDQTVNCDLSAVVFRKGKDKKEVYRTGFNWNRQSFSKLN